MTVYKIEEEERVGAQRVRNQSCQVKERKGKESKPNAVLRDNAKRKT